MEVILVKNEKNYEITLKATEEEIKKLKENQTFKLYVEIGYAIYMVSIFDLTREVFYKSSKLFGAPKSTMKNRTKAYKVLLSALNLRFERW